MQDWFWMWFVFAAYFMPTLLALWGRRLNWLSVFVVNLFLGWTLLGWVAALAWAVKVDRG